MIDHGIPVPAAETRAAAVCCRADGEARLVIAARGFVLVVHPLTGDCRQVHFPDGRGDYPYACLAGSDGTFYTGAGAYLLGVDPFAGELRVRAHIGGGNVGFSFAEAADGLIYFAVQGSCELWRFDPAGESLEQLGQLDPRETYPCTLAVGDDGWLYAGIGTAHRDIVALQPRTGERRSLLPPAERGLGAGYVDRGLDGQVYGQMKGALQAGLETPGAPWYRLANGAATPVPRDQVGASSYRGVGFDRLHGTLPGDWRIERVDLAERRVDLVHVQDASKRRSLALVYDCAGAQLSALVAAPDGWIYGTSGHPQHVFRFQPETEQLQDIGGGVLENARGGGNICAYAVAGSKLYGARYPGGQLHCLDTADPIDLQGRGASRNPRLVAECPQAYRPRCCLAHPDGQRILFGGYGGYGEVGGALAIFDSRDETLSVLPHQRLVPGHSVISLAADAAGRVLAGTCVNSPGGGRPIDDQGRLLVLDADCQRVQRRLLPIPGARSLIAVAVVDADRVLVLSTCNRLALAELGSGKTLTTRDLSLYGPCIAGGLLPDGQGGFHVLTRSCILHCDAQLSQLGVVTWLPPSRPITASGVRYGDRLVYTSGTRLYSLYLQRYTA